jgi:hypothetical protein
MSLTKLFEKTEVLQMARQGMRHIYDHHSKAAEIEQAVLEKRPEKERSHSIVVFHVYNKALALKVITQIDIKLRDKEEAKPPLRLSSTIERDGNEISTAKAV